MCDSFKVIYENGTGEIVEKKSRFIAHVFHIEKEEEAVSSLDEIRKKYWDATHHCFAYLLGDKNNIQRCSDDGEPSGTAGRPMLDILLGEDIHNVLVVVTRYFGGTLLGTGGLVKAYSAATKEGLKKSRLITRCQGKKIHIRTDYNGIGKLQYIAAQMDLTIMNTEYTDMVDIIVMVPEEKTGSFETQITEATSGRALFEIESDVYYGIIEGNVVLLK